MPSKNAELTFSDNVLDTFVDHINLSLPPLQMGHELTCQILKLCVPKDMIHATSAFAGVPVRANFGQIRRSSEQR